VSGFRETVLAEVYGTDKMGLIQGEETTHNLFYGEMRNDELHAESLK